MCSTVHKTISKILVNRLQPLLTKIVSPTQSAFVEGRAIHDNILITHEIMHKFKQAKGKTAWVALKIDMEKAYDRLEWDFIEQCLKKFGFHSIWIKWIMECIDTISYSLLVNDEPTGLFCPMRRIRQGDPLSPYLFIMCMEALNSTLSQAAKQNKTGIGIKIANGLDRIPCLLFTDDCLLFCKADYTNCVTLKTLLDQFCTQSGQLINYHKSTLMYLRNATAHQ